MTLFAAIRKFVQSRPRSSIDEVIEATGKMISAAQAIRYGKGYLNRNKHRKRPLKDYVAAGKRKLIGNLLYELYRRGLIEHLGKGLYGPKAPTIYVPPSQIA